MVRIRREDALGLRADPTTAATPEARTQRDLNALLKISTALSSIRGLAALEEDRVLPVEVVQEVLGGHAEGAEKYGGVELPPPVDPDVEDVLRVELEVDP